MYISVPLLTSKTDLNAGLAKTDLQLTPPRPTWGQSHSPEWLNSTPPRILLLDVFSSSVSHWLC